VKEPALLSIDIVTPEESTSEPTEVTSQESSSQPTDVIYKEKI